MTQRSLLLMYRLKKLYITFAIADRATVNVVPANALMANGFYGNMQRAEQKHLFAYLAETEQSQLKTLLQKLLTHWRQYKRKTE